MQEIFLVWPAQNGDSELQVCLDLKEEVKKWETSKTFALLQCLFFTEVRVIFFYPYFFLLRLNPIFINRIFYLVPIENIIVF